MTKLDDAKRLRQLADELQTTMEAIANIAGTSSVGHATAAKAWGELARSHADLLEAEHEAGPTEGPYSVREFHIERRWIVYVPEGLTVAMCSGHKAEANARFIKVACNAHETLVAAMKRIAEAYPNTRPSDIAREALESVESERC